MASSLTPLAGRVAVITGSTSGIGLGIARVFAQKGATVVMHGLEGVGVVDGLKEELNHPHLHYDPTDLMHPTAPHDIIKRTEMDIGPVSILVNNAGIQHVSPVVDFGEDAFERVVYLNLTVPFKFMKETMGRMKEDGFGRVINIASVHGLVGSVDKSAYVAAKHGLVGLTKVAALEFAGTGVTANAICPGWVSTPLVQAQIVAKAEREGTSIEEATKNLLGEKQPSEQFVTPEDLGELAAFLSSPAAAQMTGITAPMDGGWTAR